MGLAFALVAALRFLWGAPNHLNDVLIRPFMKSFAIARFQAGLVQPAFYFGCLVPAMSAVLLMRRYGCTFGFVAGLCLLAAGNEESPLPGSADVAVRLPAEMLDAKAREHATRRTFAAVMCRNRCTLPHKL